MLVKLIMKVLSNLLGNNSKIKYTEIGVQKDNKILNIKEYVDNGDVYSFNEVKTNKIWIDSNNVEHPIYRKYIEVGALTKNVEKTVDSNTNIDFFTKDITGFYNFSGFIVPINFSNLGTSYSNANYSYCFFDKTNQQFRVKTSYDAVTNCYLIIEYTKTTD